MEQLWDVAGVREILAGCGADRRIAAGNRRYEDAKTMQKKAHLCQTRL